MDGDGLYLNGSLSPLETYKTLFRNRDMPVVLDDIEDLMNSRKQRTMLKNLADTYEVKELSWRSSTPRLNGVPGTFKTTSNVCIICNEFDIRGLNKEALEKRGLVLDFYPTNDELIDRMELVTKSYQCGLTLDERYEVFEFIREWVPFAEEADLRTLVIGFQLMEGGEDWRDVLQRGMNVDERLILVTQLVQNHGKIGDAAKAFHEATGQSQRTFYTLWKDLKREGDY